MRQMRRTGLIIRRAKTDNVACLYAFLTVSEKEW